MKSLPFPSFNLKHTALLVIDLQNDFCAKEGWFEKIHKHDCSRLRRIISPLTKLIQRARKRSMPIIFTQFLGNPELRPISAREKYNLNHERPFICLKGTWGAGFYKIKPSKKDTIVPKSTFSAFRGTNLSTLLKRRNIQTLLITGVLTHGCVEGTVREAFDRGYHCVVLKDCVASWNQTLHKYSLENMDRYFAYILSSSSHAL